MNTRTHNIRRVLLLLLSTILALSYFMFAGKNKNALLEPISAYSSISHTVLNDSTPQTETSARSEPSAPEGIKPGTAAWAIMFKEFVQWIEERGYYVLPGQNSEYNGYSEQTLKNLAESGDLKAIMLLGDNALHKEGNIKKARNYFHQAALRGSTSAINNLGIFAIPPALIYNSEEKRKQTYYETLAFDRVLEMRGDKFMGKAEFESTVKIYHLNLVEEDYIQINKRAQKIYDGLQAQRTVLGLGDFDNSVPTAYK